MNDHYTHRYRRFVPIVCAIVCMLFCRLDLKANNITGYSFAIGEFPTRVSLNNYLESLVKMQNPGLSLSLGIEATNGTIHVVMQDSLEMPFSTVLPKIDSYLKQRSMVFPLFIDYDGSEEKFVGALKEYGLLDQVFVLPDDRIWPDIDDLILNKKKLIVFNTSNNAVASRFWTNFNKHVYEYPLRTSVIRKGESAWNGNGPTQRFMSLKSFTSPFLNTNSFNDDSYNINTNAYLLEHSLECWERTGKVPNFIFFSDNRSGGQIRRLTELLNKYPRIHGTVTSNGAMLTQLSWKHNKQSLTHGMFTFPIQENEDISLAPVKSGYRFSPKAFPLHTGTPGQHLEFTGKQAKVNEGISAYYKFDNTLKNAVLPFQEHEGGVFVDDPERGKVLKLENRSFLELEDVEKYKIVNSSFTISIYVKFSSQENHEDYCILGSNSGLYREGLHINIRNGKPYFGFYTNDITSSDTLHPSKWYHIVARYNIENGEQSIFIDGKKVGVSWNHPSFIGEGPLLLGHGIQQENYINGLLDDLCIWNRALSDEEIEIVGIRSVENINQGKWVKITIIILLALLLGGVLVIGIVQKRFSIKNSSDTLAVKGSIHLFGGFKVHNSKGEDITPIFTPKTRELFLLLLFHTIKNPKGIAKDELTQIIWGNFARSKISNNRSVSFNRLKKVLRHFDEIDVVFENNFWKLDGVSAVPCDYKEVFSLIQNDDASLHHFIPYIKKGRFLPEIQKEWLLDFRAAFNFELIDQLLFLIKKNEEESEDLYLACHYVLELDDQNETALFYLMRNMLHSGGSNKARFIFDKFCKTYKSINASDFPHDFDSFLRADYS